MLKSRKVHCTEAQGIVDFGLWTFALRFAMKRFALIIVVTAAAAMLAACGREKPAPTAEQQAPITVNTSEVRRATLDDTFDAPGTVRARLSAVISAKVTGYVQEVRVKVGDRVHAGQTLAVLAAQDLDAQVARAAAAQLAAQSGVQEAEKARLAAESNAALAAATYQRYQTLLEKRSVSRQEFDEAEARHKSAKAGQEMAEATVARALAGQRQAEAEVQAAKVTRGYAVLAAPFAGVISEKRVDPGNLAMPGQALLTVEQAGDFRLEATVEESKIAAIKLGGTARVSIEALGASVEGRVSEIVPAVDASSRSFVVKIDLPSHVEAASVRKAHSLKAVPLELRSGLFGRATFRGGRREAIAVPETAVLRDGQLASVFVVDGGVARQRLITLGAKSGELIEVLSGLNDGDRLIVNRPAGLRDGTPIKENLGFRISDFGFQSAELEIRNPQSAIRNSPGGLA